MRIRLLSRLFLTVFCLVMFSIPVSAEVKDDIYVFFYPNDSIVYTISPMSSTGTLPIINKTITHDDSVFYDISLSFAFYDYTPLSNSGAITIGNIDYPIQRYLPPSSNSTDYIEANKDISVSGAGGVRYLLPDDVVKKIVDAPANTKVFLTMYSLKGNITYTKEIRSGIREALIVVYPLQRKDADTYYRGRKSETPKIINMS